MTNDSAISSPLWVEGRMLHCSGRWLKFARIFDEVWLDDPPLVDPFAVISTLRLHGSPADLFTFSQSLPNTKPRSSLYYDLEYLAVIPVNTFATWWHALPHASRTNVRKAERAGLCTRVIDFDANLVSAIKQIFDETPLRHGRRFRHYHCDLTTLNSQLSSYLERSIFIGAFWHDQMVGFAKLVIIGETARLMHLVSLTAQRDKRPNNALIAAAVRACADQSLGYLIYDKYLYNGYADTLTDFKSRNGFQPIAIPKYYIPVTRRGDIALQLRMHQGIRPFVPRFFITLYRKVRAFSTAMSTRVIPPRTYRPCTACDSSPPPRQFDAGHRASQ